MIVNGFRIRKAERADASALAPLVYSAIGDLANFFTGASTTQEAIERLTLLIQAEHTRFSYQYALVVDKFPSARDSHSETLVEGSVIAVCGAYPSVCEGELTLSTIQASESRGWAIEAQVRSRLLTDKEAPENTFYIDHLAVNPNFRGHHIGSDLVRNLCVKAKEEGHHTISLLADETNPSAKRLYERLLFTQDGEVFANGHKYHVLKKTISAPI